MVPPENRWNTFCTYSGVVNVLHEICDFYAKNVKSDETLVIELSPRQHNIFYHIRDDKIYKVLPETFKEVFEERPLPVK